MTKLYTALSLLLITVVSCSENISTECASDITFEVPEESITFKYIQNNIFDPNCTSSGCHGGSNVQANLNLTSQFSYQNLVGVQSLLNPSVKRVDPGSSSQSALIAMLRNSENWTSQMPPAGKIDNALIDSVAAWIDRGAKND